MEMQYTQQHTEHSCMLPCGNNAVFYYSASA